MAKYKVEVTETLLYQEEIDVVNEQEDIRKMKVKYQNQEIILDESNHVSIEFDVLEKVKKENNESNNFYLSNNKKDY